MMKQWVQQDRALRDVLAFFLLMGVLGLIARATAGATMPVVTAVLPYRGQGSRDASLSGGRTPEGGRAQSESAGFCVPIDALNADSQGYFVYLIEEKNTVLGIENILVRLPVTVTTWGDVAVQVDGALDENSRIAAESTKPLSVGARVRIRV